MSTVHLLGAPDDGGHIEVVPGGTPRSNTTTEDPEALSESDRRFLRRYVPIDVFIGGRCCFTPVVVLLRIGSVSYAASLTDLLYDEYAWAFRLAGLTFLLAAFVAHLSVNDGVCSVDEAAETPADR